MRAIQDLKNEHTLVQRVLTVLETEADRIGSGDEPRLDLLSDAVSFLRGFLDACHHSKEERFLFPALSDMSEALRSGPVSVMLSEHDQGRAYVKDLHRAVEGVRSGHPEVLQEAVTALRRFCPLLRAHIEKEEGVLFQLAEELLSSDDDERLSAAYDSVEAEAGPGAHERFHALVDRLESVPV